MKPGSPEWVIARIRDRASFERLVAGALRSTIDAHGPITHRRVVSATKRVVTLLQAELNQRETKPEYANPGHAKREFEYLDHHYDPDRA